MLGSKGFHPRILTDFYALRAPGILKHEKTGGMLMTWLLIAGALAGIDLGIKCYIRKNKKESDNEPVLKNKIIITRFCNKGAVLGVMKDNTRMLLGISLVCFGTIFGMLLAFTRQKGNWLLKLGLTLLLGGAGSNVYERVTQKGVTDYFKLNFGCEKLKNIVFNIGDFFIFAGGLLTTIGLIRKH